MLKPCNIFFLLLFNVAVNNAQTFTVSDFDVATNFQPAKKEKRISVDYANAIDSGFIVPSLWKDVIGSFNFSFKIFNSTAIPCSLYYKIYYQNSSYKFPETILANGKMVFNTLCEENFYGSWEQTDIQFRYAGVLASGSSATINDAFRIVGNPLNDSLFYDTIPQAKLTFQADITSLIGYIKSDSTWFASIKNKAVVENVSVDEQLQRDAIYTIREERKKIKNQRWKRNPRMGNYEFLLVVATKESHDSLPRYIKDVSIKNKDHFINPFYYFKYGEGRNRNGITVVSSQEIITLFASPDLSGGIYVDDIEFENRDSCHNYFTSKCNCDKAVYKAAVFSQYRHKQVASVNSKNIPAVINWEKDSFNISDYRNQLLLFHKDSLLKNTIKPADFPCKTVFVDTVSNAVVLKNPGNEARNGIKENTGVISRHGFTYGKFTFKLQLPNQLNDSGMWNGLTNAIWLINQENKKWNLRRNCNKLGYIPKELNGAKAKRVTSTPYSEIDFEIRKASLRWPQTSYPATEIRPKENMEENTLMLSCTNWDLACPDVANNIVGAKTINYKGQKFQPHRWDHWYQALTSKFPVLDSVVFGKPFYFQIEWKPEEIIWRIGAHADSLYVVGYMNSKITSIPNNQMLMVITQEFHQSEWWPESPFLQEYVPFNGNDLTGKILEVKVE